MADSRNTPQAWKFSRSYQREGHRSSQRESSKFQNERSLSKLSIKENVHIKTLSYQNIISKFYHISYQKDSRARHSSPIGVGADLGVILSLFTDTTPHDALRYGSFDAVCGAGFYSGLRRNRNGSGFQNEYHHHFKGTVILSYIISKVGAFVISKKPSYWIFHQKRLVRWSALASQRIPALWQASDTQTTQCHIRDLYPSERKSLFKYGKDFHWR